MSINPPRGATWRKWDLHIHTPLSIIQSYGGDNDKTWKKFIEKLEGLPKEVKIIGINDYNFIDGYEKIIKEKNAGKLENIEKIFSIIEFRIDTFGSATNHKFSKVNLHVLFDIDEDNLSKEIKKIREQFIGQIHLSKHHPTTPLSKENIIDKSPNGKLSDGFAQLIPNTEEIFKLIESDTWKNKVIVFLGFIEWNNLDKGKQLKQFKEHLYKKADAFLTASRDDFDSKKSDILKIYGDKIFFHSLDLHSFEEFDEYNCLTWVKADPTFKGLKQALIESDNRISIGRLPNRLRYQEDNRDLFIESLEFTSSASKHEWFDDVSTLIFNPGLIAIIGDKGNGKSALADSIALAGNSRNTNYSFLCREKFLSSIVHKKYSVKIKFTDGYENVGVFSNPTPNLTDKEKIKYLSQSFVADLCDEIGDSSKLQLEIDRVIFSHIPSEKKLGMETLPELIESRTRSFDLRIKESQTEVENINATIIKIEEKISDEKEKETKKLLQELEKKLDDHIKNIPIKPKTISGDDFKLKLVKKYTNRQTDLENIIELRQAEIEQDEIHIHELKGYIDTAKELVRKHTKFILTLSQNNLLGENGIDPNKIISIKINTKPLKDLQDNKKYNAKAVRRYISRVDNFLEIIQARIDNIRSGLDKSQEIQHNYVVRKNKWDKVKKKLIGSKDEDSSVKWCKEELKKIKKEYKTKLSALYSKRQGITNSLIKCIFEKEENIKDIYSYAQKKAKIIADRLNIPLDEFIEFIPKISISDDFKTEFFAYISQNKSGTFYGTVEGNSELDKLIPMEGELTKERILDFPDHIVRSLNHNLSSDPYAKEPGYKTRLKDQLRAKKEKSDLYNFLFSYKYLDAKFTIAYEKKPITKLSPGEKGILLLAFYLLIDDSKLPILIDQPEEQIGNKTIFKRLVKFVNFAKTKRQIIIVTHSANLAIVCDADQILHSQIDKSKRNKLTYTSGSIEFDPIKGQTIDILEGTKDAFDNRKIKYEI